MFLIAQGLFGFLYVFKKKKNFFYFLRCQGMLLNLMFASNDGTKRKGKNLRHVCSKARAQQGIGYEFMLLLLRIILFSHVSILNPI